MASTNMLDAEWVKLILEAKKQGLTIEEIQLFLNSHLPEVKPNYDVEISVLNY